MGKPFIKLYGGENKIISENYVGSYVDIIYNNNYDTSKILVSISYILNRINNTNNSFNFAEEEFIDNYSGNNLYIYSDEAYSGNLNIDIEDNKNYLNNYNLPYKGEGYWNFNYFRNKLTNVEQTNKIYDDVIVPIRNKDTNVIEYVKLSEEQLKLEQNIENNKELYKNSDNHSYIFGKYFITRFVFNPICNIKFDKITFNVNKY